MAEVTKQTCRLYAKQRSRSANTIRRELSVLRAAINFAHEEGRITRPVHVELPAPSASRKTWLTREQAARLIRASRTPSARLYMPLFILLGIYTGRRKEAILSLRWHQVDLTAELIDFEARGRKQTNKRRGAVRIPPRLLPHLRRARKRGTDLGYVLHRNGDRILDVKKGFAGACKRAGLEGVTPHTLRHTAATWLMQRVGRPFGRLPAISLCPRRCCATYTDTTIPIFRKRRRRTLAVGQTGCDACPRNVRVIVQ